MFGGVESYNSAYLELIVTTCTEWSKCKSKDEVKRFLGANAFYVANRKTVMNAELYLGDFNDDGNYFPTKSEIDY